MTKTIAKVISLLAILIALYPWVIWIIIFNQTSGSNQTPADLQTKRDNTFLSYFPAFIRSNAAISLVSLVCAILGIIFSIIWQRREPGARKAIPLLVLILSALILLLTLFSMM